MGNAERQQEIGAVIDYWNNVSGNAYQELQARDAQARCIREHSGNQRVLARLERETSNLRAQLKALSQRIAPLLTEYQTNAAGHAAEQLHRDAQQFSREVNKRGLDWVNKKQQAADARIQRNIELAEHARYNVPLYLGPGPHPSPQRQRSDYLAAIKRQRAKELQPKARARGLTALEAKGNHSTRRVMAAWRKLVGVPTRKRAAIIAKLQGLSPARVRQIIPAAFRANRKEA